MELRPLPDNWSAGSITVERAEDGTWSGMITMGCVHYHLRGYHKTPGGQIAFEFQEHRDPEWEAYLDAMQAHRMAG